MLLEFNIRIKKRKSKNLSIIRWQRKLHYKNSLRRGLVIAKRLFHMIELETKKSFCHCNRAQNEPHGIRPLE